MKKAHAIKSLGGTQAEAARRLGITASAISQWPDELEGSIEDRVLAELARMHLPADMIGAELVADEAGDA